VICLCKLIILIASYSSGKVVMIGLAKACGSVRPRTKLDVV